MAGAELGRALSQDQPHCLVFWIQSFWIHGLLQLDPQSHCRDSLTYLRCSLMAISSCLKLCSQGASSNIFSSWSLQSLHQCVTLKGVDRAPLVLGNMLQGRTTQPNPLSLCGWFQLPATSGWRRVGTSLWLSPSRARRLSSFLPTSHSWMGSCCPLSCFPRAWAWSVWLGTHVPAPPFSGKSFAPPDMHGVGMWVGCAGSSSPQALFLVSVLTTFCWFSLWAQMVSYGFWGRAWLQHVQTGPRLPWEG